MLCVFVFQSLCYSDIMGDLPRHASSHRSGAPLFSVSATVGYEKATPQDVPWHRGQRLHEYTNAPKLKSTDDSFGRWQYPERRDREPGEDRDAKIGFAVSAIVNKPTSPTKEMTMEERRRAKLSPEIQQRNAEYQAATPPAAPPIKRTFVRGQGFRTNEERGYTRAPPNPSSEAASGTVPAPTQHLYDKPVPSTTSSPAKASTPLPPPKQNHPPPMPQATGKFMPFVPLFPPNWYDREALLKMERPEPPLGPVQLKLIETVAKVS